MQIVSPSYKIGNVISFEQEVVYSMWLSTMTVNLGRPTYASNEVCCADNDEPSDVPGKVKGTSVDVHDMDERALFLEKDAGWNPDVEFFNFRLVEMGIQY